MQYIIYKKIKSTDASNDIPFVNSNGEIITLNNNNINDGYTKLYFINSINKDIQNIKELHLNVIHGILKCIFTDFDILHLNFQRIK